MMHVSVVMAAYNAELYVAEAIESVLGQSVPPSEVIVVDDGSTDRTRAIVEGFSRHVTLVTQDNRGQTAALNRAIGMARGELLAFQDADDIWAGHKQALQLAALEADPDVGAVFGLMQQFISPDVPPESRPAMQPEADIAPGEIRTCMLIRRSEFDRIGMFDPAYRGGVSFVEWLGRAKRMGLATRMLDQVIVHRRLHSKNYGRTNTGERDEETMNALRSIILQRRKKRW
jgi:glycosyltransferase involved in cell wall biosynthesis